MNCPKKPLSEADMRSDSASAVSDSGRMVAADLMLEAAVLPTDDAGNLQLVGLQGQVDVQPVAAQAADGQHAGSDAEMLELAGKKMAGVRVDPRPTKLTMLLNALTYAGGAVLAGVFLFWLSHSPKGEAFVAFVDRMLEKMFGN
jgi:hypothetical protein